MKCGIAIRLNIFAVFTSLIVVAVLASLDGVDTGKHAYAFHFMVSGLVIVPLLSLTGILNMVSVLRLTFLISQNKGLRVKENFVCLLIGVLGLVPAVIILVWATDTLMYSPTNELIITPESILP